MAIVIRDICQPHCSINKGVITPARTPPNGTEDCLIENTRGCNFSGVTLASICELAGVAGPKAAPIKAAPTIKETIWPVDIRITPTAVQNTKIWVARIGLILATQELAKTPIIMAAMKTMLGWPPIHIGLRPISGSACIATTGGAKTPQEIIDCVRISNANGPKNLDPFVGVVFITGRNCESI